MTEIAITRAELRKQAVERNPALQQQVSTANHVFRVRFHVGGGHVHCQLYVRSGEHGTFAMSGNFVVRRGAEFRDLMKALGGVEFVGIAEDVGIEVASGE